jgi:hypothetical protein
MAKPIIDQWPRQWRGGLQLVGDPHPSTAKSGLAGESKAMKTLRKLRTVRDRRLSLMSGAASGNFPERATALHMTFNGAR